MQIHTAAEAPPAAVPDPDIGASLPALVMGERAQIEREHQWPGSLFFVLSYVAAVGMGAGALACAGYGLFSGEDWLVGLAVGLAVGAAAHWRLATEVERFTRWGWYGAMVALAAASIAKLWGMMQGNLAGGMIGLGIDLAWMRYFWEFRHQFDIDID